MTNYFFKIVIWLHYWLLHLKSNQITNYFAFKLSNLKNTLQRETHSSFINLGLQIQNRCAFCILSLCEYLPETSH